MQAYRLREIDLAQLKFLQSKNPHYRTAAPMIRFLHTQVRDLAQAKWGSPEPYTVLVREFSGTQLAWLQEDPKRLKQLGPERFQCFIADRLERLGLVPQLVGDVNRKDGGIDIIACPQRGCFPFLLAIQIKHHRTDRKTGASDVRDFHGVLTSRSSPFHAGLIVTNTTFTADAKWFAEHNRVLLRLRDLEDLRRWLQDDFANEAEWREIPEEIEVAPGIVIQVPRPQLWVPPSVGGPGNSGDS